MFTKITILESPRKRELQILKTVQQTLLLAAAFFLSGLPLARAADRYWNATLDDCDWSTPEYWGGLEPTSADKARIENGGTAHIAEFGEICNELYLGNSSTGNSGSVQMTGGDLTAARISVYDGVFDHSGGINLTTYVFLPNDDSQYRLSGTGVLMAGELTVGSYQSEEAAFIQSGGTNTVAGTLGVGFSTYSKGRYEMQGGVLSARNSRIGYAGAGTFTQTAGVNSVSERLTLGYNAGSNGTYHLGGNGRLNAADEDLNIGTFNQTGGINFTSSLSIGNSGGEMGGSGNCLYNLTGPGQLIVDISESIGSIGTGKFVQTAGIHTVRNIFYLGPQYSYNYGSGTYELSGTGQFTANSESINGTFTHSSGVHTAGSIDLGTAANTMGTYELSGTGILRSANVQVGLSGSGIFTQSGGIHRTNKLLIGASSIYNLTGGILEVKTLGASSANSTFNFGGGTIRPPITNPPTALNLSMATTLTGIGGDAKIDIPRSISTLSPSMSGAGGLKKLGAGTLKLSGTNSYSGSTTVEEGTLYIKKAASLANYGTAGKVVINTGAALTLKAGGTSEWTANEIRTAVANAVFHDESIFGIDTDAATGDNFIYGNELAGNFHFSKLGSDTLTLAGVLDYPGTTTISSGTLCIATPTSVQSNVMLHDIVGTGNLIVGDGANPTNLTAISINVSSLAIRGTSGAAQAVPEPGAIAILLSVFAAGMISLRRFWKNRRVLLAAAMILANSPFLHAASRYWTATLDECDWSVPVHWGGTEPTSGDDAYITNGGTACVSQSGESCYSLSVGNPGTENISTVRMTGGELYAPATRVGYSGTGIFDQSGGSIISSDLNVGVSATKTSENGTYNLSGSAQLSTTYESIGGSMPAFTAYPGTGVFTQSGGINSVAETLGLGTRSGSSGTYRLIGEGQLSAKTEYVGDAGVGTFIHSAGINTVSETLIVGNYSNAPPNPNSRYALSGTGQLTAYNEEILFGTFDQTGGINTAATLYVGSMPGSNYPPPASSAYNLSGSGQLSVFNSENIGGVGTTGIFTQTGGVHTVAGTLNISTTPLGTASYLLGGTGSLSVQSENIGSSGKGAFSQTGGTHTVAGTLTIGNNSSSVGTYELSGNGQLLAGNVTIGSNAATGTFTQSDGTNRILGTLSLTNPNAAYTLNGGTLIVKTLPNSPIGQFNFGGGTLQPTSMFVTMLPMKLTGIGGDAKIDTRQYLLTLNGSLSGVGGLKKLGGNNLTIAGTNSYSGGTTVEEGILHAMRPVSLPDFNVAGKIVVNGGSMLSVNAGSSPGWLAADIRTLTANATFQEGAIFGIVSSAANFNYDNILSGNFGLTKLGANRLTLAGEIGYSGITTISGGSLCICTPASTQANVVLHDIVGTGSLIVGDGVNPTNLTAASIRVGSLSIQGSSPGMAAVPEPSALALLLMALAAGVYPLRKRIAP